MSFTSIAEYYEILSEGETRLERERPFLERVFGQCSGSYVADIACGTGLHAEFFSDLGADVTGFDISPEMVRAARTRHCRPHLRFVVADMLELAGGSWHLILCLGNSLSLLGGVEDVRTTFHRVESCLTPRGIFLVQVINYESPVAQQARHRVERRSLASREIVAVKSLVPHGDRTLLSIVFHDVKGEQVRSVSETAVLMHLTLGLLRNAASTAGLKVKEVFGNYNGDPYSPDSSSDLIMLFQKPA